MHKTYTNCNSEDLFAESLLRREKRLLERRIRNNVTDFIALLSRYIPNKPVVKKPVAKGLYEQFCKKHGEMPYGGYTLRIAIEKLPGNFKKNSSKKYKTVNYVI